MQCQTVAIWMSEGFQKIVMGFQRGARIKPVGYQMVACEMPEGTGMGPCGM